MTRPRDDGGPAVAVCLGPRCAALLRLRDPGGALDPGGGLEPDTGLERGVGLEPIRSSIRSTTGGMLITAGYLGPCFQGAVMTVGWRRPGDQSVVPTLLLAQMETPGRTPALSGWLDTLSGERELRTRRGLPEVLADAREIQGRHPSC